MLLACGHPGRRHVHRGRVVPRDPPTGNPTGVSDTPIAPFPADGPTYAVLSRGDATLADQPDQAGIFASADDGGAAAPAGRGDTARDVTVLTIPINVPAAANCLSFDFRFLSEEYPDFLDSQSTMPSSPRSTARPRPSRDP